MNADGVRKTILLVEDEAIIALSEAKVLRQYGFDVKTALAAENAINIAEQEEVDLILMDIDLGKNKMPGTEAARAILKNHDIPIVFLSSHTEREVVESTEGITSYGYIVKNSGETVLIASIKMAFRLFEAKMGELNRTREYQALFKNINVGVALHEIVVDDSGLPVDFIFLDANPAYEEMTQLKRDEIVGRRSKEVIPNIEQRWIDIYGKVALSGEPIAMTDHSAYLDRFWEVRAFSPGPNQFAVAMNDTTDRVRNETALRENEEAFRGIIEGSPIAVLIYRLDKDDRLIFSGYNEVANSKLGLDCSQFMGKTIEEAFPPLAQTEIPDQYRMAAKDGVRYYTEDLTYEHGSIAGSFEVYAFQMVPGKVAIMFNDITERKRLARKLEQTEEMHRPLIDALTETVADADRRSKLLKRAENLANVGSWEWDMVGDRWTFSDQWRRIHGANSANLTTRELLSLAHPDDAERINRAFEEAQTTGERYDIRHRIIRHDNGEVRLIHSIGEVEFEAEHGTPIRMTGAALDITENEKSVEKIRFQASLLESVDEAVIATDVDGTITYFNRGAEQLSGWTSDEAIGRNIRETLPEQKPRPAVEIVSPIAQRSTWADDFELGRKNGSTFWAHVKNSPVFDEDGILIGVIRIIDDISERKQKDRELVESREKFVRFFNTNPSETFVWEYRDGDFVLTAVNNAADDLNDGLARVVVGETASEIYRKKPIMREKLLECLESKSIIEFEHQYKSERSGEREWVNVRLAFQEPNSVLLYFDAVTDRKKAEENLKRALEEKDFLLRELSHRIKNNLMMISSLVSLKNDAVGNEIDLTDIKHQIDAIRIVHQKLYQSDDVSRINMREYLRDLLATVFSFAEERVRVEDSIEEIMMEHSVAVPLGLIVNEIATNAMKHGFAGATDNRFAIELHRSPTTGEKSLSLSNTGNPFPEGVDLDNPSTLGLRLISALVKQIDGTIELNREPQARFTIRLAAVAD